MYNLPGTAIAGRAEDREMSNNQHQKSAPAAPLVYQIKIEGKLGPQWATWFDGLTITPGDGGTTLLTGPVVDQAALHGLLRKVRDLGLPLFSVNRVAPDQADATDVNLTLLKS